MFRIKTDLNIFIITIILENYKQVTDNLHGYTVQQWYQILYCPTNALKYIKSLIR